MSTYYTVYIIWNWNISLLSETINDLLLNQQFIKDYLSETQ